MTSKDNYNVLSVLRELRHYLEPRVPQIAKVSFSYLGVLRRGSIEAYVKTKRGGLSTVFNNNKLALFARPYKYIQYCKSYFKMKNQNYIIGQLSYFGNNFSRRSKQAEKYFMKCILIIE